MNLMNSLFSSFDPMSGSLTLNYLVIIMVMMLPLFSGVFIMKQRMTKTSNIMLSQMEAELNTSMANKNKEGKSKMLIMMFLLIMFLNVVGLLPYVFTITAQMAFTLSMALPFWLSFIMFSMSKNLNSFLAHMVPTGTPMALSQFMTLIESVSQIIRPITLSVRLAANMTAGHILIALSSASVIMLNHMSLILMMLLILEIAVAFIQSYVFVVLITMYLSETN